MARKKAELKEETKQEPQVPERKAYAVIERFRGNINNRPIEAREGETVMLNDHEYRVLKRFLKD